MAKATIFLLSQQRPRYFHGNLGCMKSAKFSTTSRMDSVEMKSFTSTRRSRSASKNKYAVPAFPFNFEWPSITSEPEENNPSETKMFNNIFKTEKKSGQKANQFLRTYKHGGKLFAFFSPKVLAYFLSRTQFSSYS